MAFPIPIVDLEEFNLTKDQVDVSEDVQHQLAHQLIDAFNTVGFVGVKNYGIPQDKLSDFIKEAKTFFNLPESTKRKYLIHPQYEDERGGWTCMEQESVNPERPGDLKETFNVVNKGQLWPNDEVPGFRPVADEFLHLCWNLAQRILLLIGIGLGLEDPRFLQNLHSKDGSSCLRCLHYPAITDVKPNQLRCGEHTDYGSITLLFQDDIGGLEVRSRDGQYVPVPPVAGTIMVNIGGMMQRWTTDKLIATMHRVLIPEAQSDKEKARMSVAYFEQPDNDCLIRCLDGSNKYEPIKSIDYLNMRLSLTY